MFLKSVTALFFSLAILATSCKKGDTGPQGEKGDTGEKGATGATGATGKTGTANVIYSAWEQPDWGYISSSDTNHIFCEITAPKITDSVLNYGVVHVYFNLNSAADPNIVSLPFIDTYGIFTGMRGYELTPIVANGAIDIVSYYSALMPWWPLADQNSAGENIHFFRYVIIPGGSTARTAVNWNDYKQVKSYLGLKD